MRERYAFSPIFIRAVTKMININYSKYKKDIIGWFIMLPCLLLFTFFIWHPLLSGIQLSFCKVQGFQIVGFAGFDNYVTILSQSEFIIALKNTMKYTLWSLVIGFFVPIVIAIFVNEVVHCKGLFRLGIYFPSMVPGIVAFMMWGIMMQPGTGGLFNSILAHISIEPLQWLQDTRLSIPLIIVTMTWKFAGGTVLIYMASLQDIPQELYEAASVDGASIFSKIKNITLPSIMPLVKMMLILQIISVFQVLQEPLVMTNGGPVNSSLSLLLLNYFYAFRDFKIELAATVGVIVSVILMLITLIYFKVSKTNKAD